MTIEEKLQNLLDLQDTDNQMNKIINVRGALPEEVATLENQIHTMVADLEVLKKRIQESEVVVSEKRITIKSIEELIRKYESQQMEVRNNREYDAITKEIELQKIEIQLYDKKIKEIYGSIESDKLSIESLQNNLVKSQQLLSNKQQELEVLIKENEAEEKNMQVVRDEIICKLSPEDLKSYERIRNGVRNKLAIVRIQKNACGGCFIEVPPQTQIDIAEKKLVSNCEYCGRILAEVINYDKE